MVNLTKELQLIFYDSSDSVAVISFTTENITPFVCRVSTVIDITGRDVLEYFTSNDFFELLRQKGFTLKDYNINESSINLWVNALRSGKYWQCRNSFITTVGKNKSYCALGVYLASNPEYVELDGKFYDTRTLHELPFTELPLQGIFFMLNDDLSLPFLTIADFAEKFYKKLLTIF